MICHKCGNNFEGNFCPNCGARAQPEVEQEWKSYIDNKNDMSPARKLAVKVLLAIGSGCLVLMVIVIILSVASNSSQSEPALENHNKDPYVEETQPVQATVQPTVAIPDDAPLIYYVELANNFDSYKDQYVKFACRVKSILVEKITLDNSDGGGSGTTVITFADPDLASKLAEDQYITVIGKVGVSGLGHYYIGDAKVVDYSMNSLKLYGEQKEQYNDGIKESNADAKAEYIANCTSGYVSYTDLIRNPDIYATAYVKLTVTIQQKMSGGLFDSSNYYRCYCGDDEFIIKDSRDTEIPKLLADDEIIIYGQYNKTTRITRALTKVEEELPLINAKYIELA